MNAPVCPNCHGQTIPEDASICHSCGQPLPEAASTCPHCRKSVIGSLISTDERLHRTTASNPTRLWYLVAFLFGLVGALVGYVAVAGRNDTMAIRLIQVGAVGTAIYILCVLFYLFL